MIYLQNVNKEYLVKKNKINALVDINLSFNNKGLYFIYGRSGSGKSTLLNIIGGLEKPTSGIINNEALNETFIVFQHDNLINDFSIIDNLYVFSNDTNLIDEYLTKFDLINKKDIKIRLLSGGERQRVAIIRALLLNCKVLLLDEVTANLDHENAVNVLEILKELSKDILIICVSHDYDLFIKYADTVIKLNDGRIESQEELNDNKDNTEIVKKESQKKYFRFTEILKYALSILKTKILLNITGTIFLIISMTILILATTFTLLNSKTVLKESYKVNDYKYSPITQVLKSDFSQLERKVTSTPYLLKKLKNDYKVNPYSYISTLGYFSPTIVISDEIYNKYSNDENGIIISDFLARYYFDNEEAVGKYIEAAFEVDDIKMCSSGVNAKVTGVYESNYTEEFYSSLINDNENVYKNKNIDLLKYNYCIAYTNTNYIKSLYKSNGININGSLIVTDRLMNEYTTFKYKIVDNFTFENYQGEQIKNKNDVIVPTRYLESLNITSLPAIVNVRDINSSKNKIVYQDLINMYDYAQTLNIVGASDEIDFVLVSTELFDEILTTDFYQLNSGILLSKNDVKSALRKLSSDIIIDHSEFRAIYSIEKAKSGLSESVYGILIIALLLNGLFIFYSSISIYNNKQKELFILKAYSVKSIKLVLPIFLNELFMLLISFIIAIPISINLSPYIDKFMNGGNYIMTYTIYHIRFIPTLLALIFGLIFILISTIHPLIKINKKEINISIKNS